MSIFRVLSEPLRRQILLHLAQGEHTVGDLAVKVQISQPGISKHLKVLRDAQLVRVRVDGQRHWYRIRTEPLAELEAWLAPFRMITAQRSDDPHGEPGEPRRNVPGSRRAPEAERPVGGRRSSHHRA
ncbi:ArsR/SmtB family transcription factor [Salininema proteolyticum]|uniref:ArsR/SmtB family transcription factor n=1 Tax=Salininema proteolyticum TaxID=1607685 RepID=A0ABV8U1G3_9ACTN